MPIPAILMLLFLFVAENWQQTFDNNTLSQFPFPMTMKNLCSEISRNGNNKMCALSNTSVLRFLKEQNIIRGRDILRCIKYALMVKRNECLTSTPSLWRHSTRQVKCFCLQILKSYVKLKHAQMLVCLLP